MVVALDFACEGASGRRPRRHVFTLTMRGPDGPAPTLPFGLGRAAPDRFRSTSRKPSQPIEAERHWRPLRPASGRWGIARVAPSSRMLPAMTFVLSVTTWPEEAVARAIGSCPTV